MASSYVKQKQLEAKQASERLAQVEEEQKQKELELERITAEVQLAKQRAEEARKVAALNQLRADAAERETGLHNKDDISLDISRSPDLVYEKNAYGPGQYHGRLVQKSLPVKLKGVDLPKFSGDDKADYHNEPDVLSNQNKIWDPAEIVEFYSTISAGSRHSNFIKRHLVIVPGQVGVSSRRR